MDDVTRGKVTMHVISFNSQNGDTVMGLGAIDSQVSPATVFIVSN